MAPGFLLYAFSLNQLETAGIILAALPALCGAVRLARFNVEFDGIKHEFFEGLPIPAQAIAQVCELTWQLKGQATGRQVEGATVGITANQGLFGHGSSVIVAR